jgi:hypothetical protein
LTNPWDDRMDSRVICGVGEPMDAQSLEAVATALSALAAGGAVWAALHVWNGQKKLTRQLSKEQGELQEKLEQRHENLQKYLADKDSISTRRAALVELWPYLIDIHRIDPEKSAPEEIRKAVNTLELVALCWEANIIDKEVIQRTFESTYINIYEQVLSVTRRLPSLEKTGRELLNENPAAISLYDELKKTQVGRGRVSA